jgi:protein phosphatase
MRELAFEKPSLIILSGPSGSGKSTWAERLFPSSMIVSSDRCRELLVDDPSNQSVTRQAFELVNYLVKARLELSQAVVVDSTALIRRDRESLVSLALEIGAPVHLIVLTATLDECLHAQHNRTRQVPDKIVQKHYARLQDLERSIRKTNLRQEGFNSVLVLDRGASNEITKMNFVASTHEDLDIIGDIHGCASELQELLSKLGYEMSSSGAFVHPQNRLAVFVGDLTDRGPASVAALEIVWKMIQAKSAKLGALGNHDSKLYRAAIEGRNVQTTHGLQKTIEEIESLPVERRGQIIQIIDNLFSKAPTHSVFDNNRLIVTHGAIRPEMAGKTAAHKKDAMSTLCLYGETSGEKTDKGFPVRTYNWINEWKDPETTVIFGHDVVGFTPKRLGKYDQIIGIDTGCAFGGRLSAYRYNEREIVQVDSYQQTITHEALLKEKNEIR